MKLDYRAFFNLADLPYKYLDHNPRFFYNAPQYRFAKAILDSEVVSKAAHMYLFGPQGTGKTMLMNVLIQDLKSDQTNRVFYTLGMEDLSRFGLLKRICKEMDVPLERSYADTMDNFEKQIGNWAKDHITPILLIDDAHKLASANLSLIHHIMNFVGQDRLLIVVVLAGQEPLFRKINRKPEVKSRMHALSVDRLNLEETSKLIRWRWQVGSNSPDNPDPFEESALELVHQLTQGLPRDIGSLCDRTLQYAFVDKSRIVTPDHVTAAAQSLKFITDTHGSQRP